MEMKKALLFILLFANLNICAQRNEILDPNIASLQVMVNNNWLSLPVMILNSDDFINIGFDDLTHEYQRYCYKIEHCESV